MVLDKRPCISLGFLHLPQLLMTKKPHSKPQTWFCFRSDVMFFNWFFTEIVQPLHRKQNEGDLVCRIAVLFILKCSTTDNPSPPFSLFKGNYFPLTFFFFFLAAMRFINSSAQRFRRLGFKTSFVNCYLGAAFEWPIHCEHCVSYYQSCVPQRQQDQC